MKSTLHQLALIILWLPISVLAQTEPGGGMGGTGVAQANKDNLLEPAGMSAQAVKKCEQVNSLGTADIYSLSKNTIKKTIAVCANQKIQSLANEFIIINFYSGIKIMIKENSQIVVDKRN